MHTRGGPGGPWHHMLNSVLGLTGWPPGLMGRGALQAGQGILLCQEQWLLCDWQQNDKHEVPTTNWEKHNIIYRRRKQVWSICRHSLKENQECSLFRTALYNLGCTRESLGVSLSHSDTWVPSEIRYPLSRVGHRGHRRLKDISHNRTLWFRLSEV